MAIAINRRESAALINSLTAGVVPGLAGNGQGQPMKMFTSVS